jgi:hypothetical protein
LATKTATLSRLKLLNRFASLVLTAVLSILRTNLMMATATTAKISHLADEVVAVVGGVGEDGRMSQPQAMLLTVMLKTAGQRNLEKTKTTDRQVVGEDVAPQDETPAETIAKTMIRTIPAVVGVDRVAAPEMKPIVKIIAGVLKFRIMTTTTGMKMDRAAATDVEVRIRTTIREVVGEVGSRAVAVLLRSTKLFRHGNTRLERCR